VASVEVIGATEVGRFLAILPAHLFEAAKAAIATATFATHERVLRNLRGTPMQSRTGNLARSIIPKVEGTDFTDLRGRVYSTALYARIHELGGTVKARDKYRWLPGGPYLNIPTDDNKTAAGVMRMTSTMVFAAGGRVMVGPEGFGLYLQGKQKFRFAKEVSIKPQLGMRDAAEAEIPPLLGSLNKMLLEGLQ